MATQLPVIEYEGKRWFLDERLKQIRNIDNPHDFQDLNDFQMEHFKKYSNLIKDVDRIVIGEEKIIIAGKGPTRRFVRKDWDLFADNIRQLQDMFAVGKESTLLIFDENDMVGCQMDVEHKRIFCGKNPEKMGYL